MKRNLLSLLIACSTLGASAQPVHRTGLVAERITTMREAGQQFHTVPLFTAQDRGASSIAKWSNALAQAEVIRLDRAATATLLASRSGHISIELPEGEQRITLELERVDITTEDFEVTLASTGSATDIEEGLHYRGSIRGVSGSLAAISIFSDEVMGLISDDSGERVLGRFTNDTDGDHVFYRESDLLGTSGSVCGTPDVDMGEDPSHLDDMDTDRTVKCVRFYWEVNYDIFQGKGSVANAVNYVTGLFNQSAILYANDGISVSLSQVHVWDVPSPYTSSSTSTQLSTFGTTRTSFNGDLAHLLGYSGGGGVAFVNTICSSQTRYRMAYSDINSSYQNVPTYSWSVEVVTHEQGHNMGSKHTHACAWNGNNTAIDGCGPAAGYSEGSCTTGPVPSSSVGGTIMSYCHLTGAGIKFSNGFGPQPAALIVSRINSATCLTNCTTTSCNLPTGLVANNLTSTSTTLGWTGASGASSYTLQWKPVSASTWTTVSGLTTTSYPLSGLSAATAYHFQVLTVCASSSSTYASAVQFATTAATTCGVPSGLASNSITSSGANLAWVAVFGATNYTLQWKAASTSSWTTINSITGTSYALIGLNASTGYQFQVRSNCTSGSSSYSAVSSFTTGAATCSDVFEPNDARNNARIVPTNAPIVGSISHRYDQDWFKFSNTAAAPNIRVTLTGLPANYAITLYRGSTVVGSSNVAGTGNEQIILNGAVVSSLYTVRVSGISGAYNAGQCYALSIQISSTAFMPEEMPASIVMEDDAEGTDLDAARLFPNPTSDVVNIALGASDATTYFELIDSMGRSVWSHTQSADPISGNVTFSVEGRPVGVYFVRITRGDSSKVQRLVIAH